MERIMEAVCDDVKEAREVKKEANEIIKEIARKAEAPWETEYFEDKNDPWEYKIGYCSMENGVCVECRCWPYRGFAIDWIEDIRMLFWRLEHSIHGGAILTEYFKKLMKMKKKFKKKKMKKKEHENSKQLISTGKELEKNLKKTLQKIKMN
jgi:hypothetical protein